MVGRNVAGASGSLVATCLVKVAFVHSNGLWWVWWVLSHWSRAESGPSGKVASVDGISPCGKCNVP
jgi:hypothetical protein